jgi:hypothetical protein
MAPKSVRIATIIIVANVLIWSVLIPLGNLARNFSHLGESTVVGATVFNFVFSIPGLLIAVLLYFKLRQGRNWARILFLLLVAVTIAPLVSNFRVIDMVNRGQWGVPEIANYALYQLASPTVYIIAIVLLFSPSARAWFASKRADRQSRSRPEEGT